MNMLDGIPVNTSVYLTEPAQIEVNRTMRERWLSWPFRPWVMKKAVTIQVPSSKVYQLPNSLLMHPETFARMKAAMANLTPSGH